MALEADVIRVLSKESPTLAVARAAWYPMKAKISTDWLSGHFREPSIQA